MAGYINNTLSIVRVDDQIIHSEFLPNQMITHSGVNVTACRFKHASAYILNNQIVCSIYDGLNVF